MFRKVAAVAALCQPTFIEAEIIEFTCVRTSSGYAEPYIVMFNTETEAVKSGGNAWTSNTMWHDDFIYWANLVDLNVIDPPLGGSVESFMFQRSSGKLLAGIISTVNWINADTVNLSRYFQCSRPF